MIAQLMARHLRTPAGLFGRLTAQLMNLGNQPMNTAALTALDVQPDHRVLEVGFGGGSLFPALLERTPGGAVAGLDLSSTMLERAEVKFRNAVAAGCLILKEGTVEKIPFPAASFNRILTVNTIYFWGDPEGAAKELRRVLALDGRVVIGYGRVEDMKRLPPTKYDFRLWSPEEVEGLLAEAGFASVRSEEFVTPRRAFILTTAS